MNYYKAQNSEKHIMGPSSGKDAFHYFEEEQCEVEAVDGALNALVSQGIIATQEYDRAAFDRFRARVKESFDIPWTGISPRMRRAIYAINAIYKPQSTVCAGIFCGYTFICNAGASLGPGACYESDHLIGIEILESEAKRAANNVDRFAGGNGAAIVCADAAAWLESVCDFGVDLLYIDAKPLAFDPANPFSRGAGESEYFTIVKAAMQHLNKGALVLAHNSVNASAFLGDYLDFVRSKQFRASMNVMIDDAGLEVSIL